MRSQSESLTAGSRPVVGSSSEARGGLVEHQELGTVDERERDGEPALEAAREVAHRDVRVGAERQEVDQLLDARLELRPVEQVVAAEDAQVLDRRERQHQRVLLERDPEPRAHLARPARDVDPEHADLARARARDPVDHLERRGLARAVGAEDAEAHAGRHAEVERVHGDALAESLRHRAALDDHGARVARRDARPGRRLPGLRSGR
jgi:hypothetical protein